MTAPVPELVPARMVNEFSYCPRLFFLEWVQSRFEDNDDTAEGRYVHRTSTRPPVRSRHWGTRAAARRGPLRSVLNRLG